MYLKTTLKHFKSDPNSKRRGTENDVRTLENTFINTHKFEMDLNLQGEVKKHKAKSGMIDYVARLVMIMPKFIVIFIMSHGKQNNW